MAHVKRFRYAMHDQNMLYFCFKYIPFPDNGNFSTAYSKKKRMIPTNIKSKGYFIGNTPQKNNILGYYRATSREQSVPANTLTRLNLIGITPVWSNAIFVAEIESAEDVTAIETMFTKHFADQNSPSYSVYIKSSIAQKITINYAIFYKKQ